MLCCTEAAAAAVEAARQQAAQATWVGLVSDAMVALATFDEDLTLDQVVLEAAIKTAAAHGLYLAQVLIAHCVRAPCGLLHECGVCGSVSAE